MTIAYLVRHMRIEDIPQVVAIDRAAFSSPWSANTYQFEINNHDTSQMVVIEAYNPNTRPARGPLGWIHRLRNSHSSAVIVGYGGCWLIAGEAHISTIAVHPDHRGKGLGELLLVSMLQRAVSLNGEYSVLEVRVSNTNAQALYTKYEYKVVGRRKGYYRDDGEDAFLMEVRPLDAEYQQRMEERIAALSQRISYDDQFTRQSKPGRRV